ncbi:MAG: hypothetical protein AB2L13_09610 [Spirochaetota bacterium]
MKYHDDVASEEIIRETERHIKKIIEALKKGLNDPPRGYTGPYLEKSRSMTDPPPRS